MKNLLKGLKRRKIKIKNKKQSKNNKIIIFLLIIKCYQKFKILFYKMKRIGKKTRKTRKTKKTKRKRK